MNKPAKISLVSSIFVITGLCGSLSQAAPEVKSNAKTAKIENQFIANNVSYNYTYPSITSEIFADGKKLALPSLASISRQPMQGIQVADFAHITPNRLKKNNAIFEFAAKFNDKLQQILAIFDFSSTQSAQSQESKNNKERKVHLTSNIGNCIASKK